MELGEESEGFPGGGNEVSRDVEGAINNMVESETSI